MARLAEGKIALVTGGSSGIGRATALVFSREGATVIITDVDSKGGEETVTRIMETGGKSIFLNADVSQAREVESIVSTTVKLYGRLDIAFNNAGVGGHGIPTHEYEEDSWDRILNINLKGVWLCMKYEIAQMLRQGGGSIVNTASVAGLVGWRHTSAYVASKHGVIGLTKSAALEYAQQGIRINSVCPGIIRTPIVERVIARDPQRESWMTETEPIGRLGNPTEVAEAVVWLCSNAASFVTGHGMAVDGGWIAQ